MGDRIRVAESGLARIVGLLGERSLSSGDGLLIVPSQGVHTMGMLFPIDVLVLDDQWKALAVYHGLRPFRLTKVHWKSAAVLELPVGVLRTTATQLGDQIEFE